MGRKRSNTFDCSGLTSYVFRHVAGIENRADTYEQINAGREVSQSELQPGELCISTFRTCSYIYCDGKIIHAPQTGDVVKISTVYKFGELEG